MRMQFFCLFLFFLPGLFSFSTASAQEVGNAQTNIQFWVHGGPAVTTLGVGATAGASLEFDRNVFTLRGATTDLDFEGETWEVAFLYGRGIWTHSFFLSAAAGVSVVGGTAYPGLFGGDPASELETMMGFPVEAQAFWTPTGIVGIGLYSFANVNTGQPFGGLGLSLRVGNLR